MGRKALHTQEQVFAAADRLADGGQEVSPSSLREALGGGSLTTIYKHHEAWTTSRAARAAPVVIEMPDTVRQAFAHCWQAAATEAGKEIAAIREKADAEIQAFKRKLDQAVSSIAQLESEQEAEASRIEALERLLADERGSAQASATEAAAREAGLSATAQQLANQLSTLKEELRLSHSDVQRMQLEITDLLERERANIEKTATARNTSEALIAQLKDQKVRSLEVIGKLEQSKQRTETELTDARREAREASGNLAKAMGELEALRTQVASQADVIKGFAPRQAKS